MAVAKLLGVTHNMVLPQKSATVWLTEEVLHMKTFPKLDEKYQNQTPFQKKTGCFLISLGGFPACQLALWILPVRVSSLTSFLWRGAHPLCRLHADLCGVHIVFKWKSEICYREVWWQQMCVPKTCVCYKCIQVFNLIIYCGVFSG